MLLSTTFDIPGRTIRDNLGIARGNVVRSRFFARNIVASFRMIIGGEIHEFSGRAKDAGSAAVFLSLANVIVVWALVLFG